MKKIIKKAEELTIKDLKAHPVWEFVNSDENMKGETAVRPVKKIPVKNLDSRLVGIQVHLSNEIEIWALLGNIKSDNAHLTQHFLTLSIFRDDQCFTMARYFDFDHQERGPKALAAFLGLPIQAVFPISYDISRLCVGDIAALVGKITIEPSVRLTRDQIIELAVS